MSHHVAVTLPDGRLARADYRQPVVRVMRHINEWLMVRKRDEPPPAAITEAYAALGRWLDRHPEQACPHDRCVLHGPATPEPVTLPPYREDP